MKKNLIPVLLLLATCVSCNMPPVKDVKDITRDGKKIINSGIITINKRYEPYRYTDSLVNVDHSISALQKIDSIIHLHPLDGFLCISKGDWYFNNGQYNKALNAYNLSALMAKSESPLVLERKAKVYIKLKMQKEAINCYRKAAAINNDFYYNLAAIFEAYNQKDSANSLTNAQVH